MRAWLRKAERLNAGTGMAEFRRFSSDRGCDRKPRFKYPISRIETMSANAALPELELTQDLLDAAAKTKAWPFEEARKIVKRYEKTGFPETILFETGYGPSGLPHIGTFGEVARTTMVRHAFRVLTGDKVATRLLCFSDDMDGMRKIPDNVPDKSFLEPHLHKPLTVVPNPFGGDFESFGHHNNAMLRRFLDTFGFDYEFASATDYYKSGRFDEILLRVAERYDDIMAVMLPTLGEERRATYSPFLPISPKTGRVLYVPLKNVDAREGTITFDDEDGTETTLKITGGKVKLQWKPDFGARWAALSVDFEMFGKDHGPNMPVYDRICSALGGRPPEHFVYELFLDQNGEKISKSKGNGLTIDEWLTYAPTESLSLYMFQKPRTAKRLYFDVIPKAVDEYFTFLSAYDRQDWAARLNNPVWHLHSGKPPAGDMPVPFAMLLNLVSASNAHDKNVLWGYISRYAPGTTPETHPKLDELVGYAVRYFDDFVKPAKSFRAPDDVERDALEKLASSFEALPPDAESAAIQDAALDVARAFERYQDTSKTGPDGGPAVTGDWFQMLYQVLLGQDRGPRFGSFVALYGLGETVALIRKALAGELVFEES
jgi:lysyl-tRNA synthetase, class I